MRKEKDHTKFKEYFKNPFDMGSSKEEPLTEAEELIESPFENKGSRKDASLSACRMKTLMTS